MLQLTCYGGVGEIGGNKLLLEDGERRLLLDFGFPYKRHKLFFEEYLKPRSGAGLLDPLALGLLPPLEGLYRADLAAPGLWERARDLPGYRRLDHVDGILLSHAHMDHSGYISFLREDIPVHATLATAFIAKAMQDSGKADFDQQVCYFNPTVQQQPSGWRQTAGISGGGPKQQRQFCIGDVDPAGLAAQALDFWSSGFWEKTAHQKELASRPLAPAGAGSPFPLRCFPVDHSIPGACAWAIETSAGWVVYSGDLRLHGRRGHLTRLFMEEAAALHPRALIIEGTNALRPANVSEQEVYDNALRVIASARALVIADFSPRDVGRLLIFLDIARQTGRRLAVLPKDAYLLKTMHLLDKSVPDVAGDDSLAIYQDTIAGKYPSLWMRNICKECDSRIVLAEDVRRAQGQFILCFSFWDLNELPSLRPEPGSLYVFSSSEPHDEEQEIDFRRLHAWLQHFGVRPVGLPVEDSQGWQIPEAERGLHASGHACGPDLLEIARAVQPTLLVPVHSEHPEFYLHGLEGSGIRVMLPQPGVPLTL